MKPISVKKRQCGLTLIELLVTVIILAVGVLGLAGMQTASLRYTQDSYLQTTAMNIAQEIVDRMRANPAATDAGTYDGLTFDADSSVPSNPDCATGCSSSDVVARDRYEISAYFQDVYGLGADKFLPALPAGSSAVVTNNGSNNFTVTVAWPHTSRDVATAEGGVRNVVLEVIL